MCLSGGRADHDFRGDCRTLGAPRPDGLTFSTCVWKASKGTDVQEHVREPEAYPWDTDTHGMSSHFRGAMWLWKRKPRSRVRMQDTHHSKLPANPIGDVAEDEHAHNGSGEGD